MAKTVVYGWRYESLDEKIKWCLSLSLSERYEQIISAADFLTSAGGKEDMVNARRSFKTIQVLDLKRKINNGKNKF